MKKRLSFLLLLLLNASLFAQMDIVEQTFNDFKMLSLASDANGYYLLTKTERQSQEDYVITTHQTPALIHFDKDFREEWRLTFRETRLPELTHVKAIGDEISLSGSYYLPDQARCQFWVVCVNRNGQINWDRKYGYPNYHSVEGNELYSAPDGSLVLQGHAYRLENSYGSPFIAKLRGDGTMVWQHLYGTQYILPGFSNGVFTADGMLTFTGHVYPDRTWFQKELAKGWVVKIDCGGKGDVVWEKQFSMQAHTQFTDIVALASGEFGLVGSTGISVSATSNLTAVLSPTGELQRQEIWKADESASLLKITADPGSGFYYATGFSRPDRYNIETSKTELEILDAQFRRIDEVLVDARAVSDPQSGPDGGILTHGEQSLLIFR